MPSAAGSSVLRVAWPVPRAESRAVRVWAVPGRTVVTVHDTGHGPCDRLAGLVPAPSRTPDRRFGLGLWVEHQLDIDVALSHTGAGFTVRLRRLPGPCGSAPAAR